MLVEQGILPLRGPLLISMRVNTASGCCACLMGCPSTLPRNTSHRTAAAPASSGVDSPSKAVAPPALEQSSTPQRLGRGARQSLKREHPDNAANGLGLHGRHSDEVSVLICAYVHAAFLDAWVVQVGVRLSARRSL